jgi:small subunit ribosomal protein S12
MHQITYKIIKHLTWHRVKKTPYLLGNPQVKGICIKIFTRSPKKLNSAVRKVAKVKLYNDLRLESYIPAEGHN